MCMQSMNLIWPSMWSGGVLTDDNDNDEQRRRRRRQTNQDCIGSRPTFCREPKTKVINFTIELLKLLAWITNFKIICELVFRIQKF